MIRTPCWWEGPPTRTVAPRRRRTAVFTDGCPPAPRTRTVRLYCPSWMAVGVISRARLSGSPVRHVWFRVADAWGASSSWYLEYRKVFCRFPARLPSPPAAETVDGQVDDDPVDPGGETGLALETRQRGKRLGEGFLRDVQGILAVPDDLVRDVENTGLVAKDQGAECIPVPLGCPLY